MRMTRPTGTLLKWDTIINLVLNNGGWSWTSVKLYLHTPYFSSKVVESDKLNITKHLKWEMHSCSHQASIANNILPENGPEHGYLPDCSYPVLWSQRVSSPAPSQCDTQLPILTTNRKRHRHSKEAHRQRTGKFPPQPPGSSHLFRRFLLPHIYYLILSNCCIIIIFHPSCVHMTHL